MNYLLTYPRSGNSAIARYIQILYPDKLTFGIAPTDRRARNPENVVKAITRKAHFRRHVNKKELEKIVTVVRDYKECLMSHYKRSGSKLSAEKYFSDNFPEYVDNIVFFEECKCPKLFIYYEDLLGQTRTELEKLIDFLGVETDQLDHLIENLDYYNEMQTKTYKKNTGNVFTGSDLSKKHADTLTKKQIKIFNDMAMNSDANERLKRYWKTI